MFLREKEEIFSGECQYGDKCRKMKINKNSRNHLRRHWREMHKIKNKDGERLTICLAYLL